MFDFFEMELQDRIAEWIKSKVEEANAKGIVIGLSGGIDSAVAAALSVLAVGKENVTGLILPCDSIAEDEIDARLVADNLGIYAMKTDLTALYTAFVNDCIGNTSPLTVPKVAWANVKARLRMTTIYFFANFMNYLVCGTGNRSEHVMGYFTKYGDGATDIEPIGELLKHEVWALAWSLSLPEKIINKKPSAGLWIGQTDEDEMGISYGELDSIIESGALFDNVSSKTIDIVKNAYKKSEHKRNVPQTFKP